MSKKNHRKKYREKWFEEKPKEPRLHPETKKSIWAIVFLGIAAVLILASFKSAGPFGNFLYLFFEKLFGRGYYLLPAIFLVLAGVFLTSERQRIYQITFLGAGLFTLAGLGLIDIIFPDRGGWVGRIVGFLEIPFGYTASIIIVIIVIIISFLVTLNLPIKIKKPQKALEVTEPLKVSEVVGSPVSVAEPTQTKAESKAEEIQEKIQEKIARFSNRPKTVALKTLKGYVAPPLGLLRSSIEKPTAGDLRANANIIKRTLESFGIPVEMGEINIGPKVTRYTLKPAEGIKLSRITALNQDLSLALASHPIRIEAPIPGKSLVGIEVPNKASALVRLGSLMAYPEFSSAGLLGFVLGRDVNGEPIFTDIDKMPHMLIAGSTGSGKSIMIHSLLISLLYKNSPATLRLILIDPKRVELSIYNNLPHLVSPVITESKKALAVFRWAIEEMERRYELLLQAGSRDIQSYNKKYPEEPLPYILIVVDELADLMFSYGRDVEGSVVRLAQMARATGLHLILSTQRPSVEVVTGLIKANITCRVALQLPSQVDSRTVLDSAGAEKLLGGGDMLFVSSESSKPKRIQGAYIPEEEVRKVTDFIRENNKDFWEQGEQLVFENGVSPVGPISEDGLDKYSGDEEDELYEEAVRVVSEAKKASASLLQRRLKVGYARAARLLDIMEARGVVGPGEGAKPREVFIKETTNNYGG
ncbi:DNA translocase FtsK [Candidatus Wolfebacteria bacterium]|uniref:Cell division protein FtsK n=1 Tax=Candidatus Wolfebacteria bacterium CG_4_10_14_0_8_um_filter_39_64 TaxID=1975063 RepID=A0A2M7Q670_9BACT|nr:DNA translocase FtsK [Parcubacteria group bacterium]NCP58165.1 DNA translocase FtsK [Candidatus Wolfebacteria bacterium]PIY58936.1 MAG: cell division protein FtsK [Candidatus Wolfebacteria bacterium CG_4_10_14_0_8_um_filter_39_64]